MYKTSTRRSQTFHPEPAFYDGAMYVSYALQAAVFVTVFITIKVLFPTAGPAAYIIGVTLQIILLIPMIYRISRSLWIHFFVAYDGNRYQGKMQS